MRFLAGMVFGLALASTLAGQQVAAPTTTAAPQKDAAAPSHDASPSDRQCSHLEPAIVRDQSAYFNACVAGCCGGSSCPSTAWRLAVLPDDPKDVAKAKREFKTGMKLKSSGNLDAAFEKFELAAKLAPHNAVYLTAREFTREELVMQALKQGNQAMLDHDEIVAMAAFRRALEFDPTNEYALQRLTDSMPLDEEPLSRNMRVVEQSTPIEMQPAAAHHDFHYRGDARAMLTQVTQAYGITAQFEDSVLQKRVRFDIEDVNFATAMEVATRVTKTFWVPLSTKQILFVADTVENRRNYQRMSLRTFYLPDLATDQELTEMTNSLRVLLNLRYIAADKAQSTISIRAEDAVVEAAGQLLESLAGGRPESLLDMRVYEISSKLPKSARHHSAGAVHSVQYQPGADCGPGTKLPEPHQPVDCIRRNQPSQFTGHSDVAGIPLQSSQLDSIDTVRNLRRRPTLFGLTGGTGTTITFNLNQSDIRSLEHVTLRASQNNAAVFKVGERYPIVNATFAPIFNSPAISQVIGNQSFIAPFPSFNFEDLGLNLKATPIIHADRDVTLKIELNIRSLGAQTVNGIPIINNREYTGSITLKKWRVQRDSRTYLLRRQS